MLCMPMFSRPRKGGTHSMPYSRFANSTRRSVKG
jgi:hypothetical protein